MNSWCARTSADRCVDEQMENNLRGHLLTGVLQLSSADRISCMQLSSEAVGNRQNLEKELKELKKMEEDISSYYRKYVERAVDG